MRDGVVKIETGDPRYCWDENPDHDDHFFEYEYMDLHGNLVKGIYHCTRTNRGGRWRS